MQLSQPTLEPHSLCYTCWVQVVYSLLPTLLFCSCSLWGHPTATQFLQMRRSSPGTTRSTRTSRRSSPSRRPCGAQLPRDFVYVLRFCILCIRHFVIIVINNIRTRFIISFYVICAVIYCTFCCIYVWLDPGTYIIARFMSFYKSGVTLTVFWPKTGANGASPRSADQLGRLAQWWRPTGPTASQMTRGKVWLIPNGGLAHFLGEWLVVPSYKYKGRGSKWRHSLTTKWRAS